MPDIFDQLNPPEEDIFDQLNPLEGDVFDKLNPSEPDVFKTDRHSGGASGSFAGPGIPERIGRGVVTGGVQTLGSFFSGIDYLADSDIAEGLSTDLRKFARETAVPNPTFFDEVAQGFGSSAIFWLPGIGISRGSQALANVAPRVASLLGTGVSTALESLTEAGDTYQTVLAKTGNESKATSAANKTLFWNVPLIAVTNKFGIFAEKGGALRRTLLGAGLEGVQEFGQELIGATSTETPFTLERGLRAAAAGSIVAAPFSAVGGVRGARADAKLAAAIDELTGTEESQADVTAPLPPDLGGPQPPPVIQPIPDIVKEPLPSREEVEPQIEAPAEETEDFIASMARLRNSGVETAPVAKETTKPPGIREIEAAVKKSDGFLKVDDVVDPKRVLSKLLSNEKTNIRKAFKEGKNVGVTTERVQRVINDMARKKQASLKAEVDSIVRNLKSTPDSLPIETKESIEDVLKDVDLARRTKQTLKGRKLASMVAEAQQTGELNIPQREMDVMHKKSLNEMTIDELRYLDSVVTQLKHAGQQDATMMKVRAGEELESVLNDVTEPMTQVEGVSVIPEDQPVTDSNRKKFQHRPVKRAFSNFYQRNLRAERILLRLDGYVENGPNQQSVFMPFERARTESARAQQSDTAKIQDVISRLRLDLHKTATEIRKVNDRLSLTGEEMMEVFIARLDEGKLQHLKEGNRFSDQDIEDTVNAMTPQEKAYATWEVANYWAPQYEKVNAVYRKLYNKNLPRIKNYSQISIDWENSNKNTKDSLDKDLAKELFGRDTLNISYVERGFTKERHKGATAPLSLRHFDNLYKNLDAVNHFIAFGEAARDVKKVVNSKRYKDAVSKSAGAGTHRIIQEWMDDVISQESSRNIKTPGGPIFKLLRNHTGVAMLGFLMTTVAKQPVSSLLASSMIGSPAVLNGMQQYARNHSEIEQFVFDRSPQLKNRAVERDIRDMMKNARKTGVFSKKDNLSVRSLWLLRQMDKMTVVSVWKGAYDQHLAKNVGDEQGAIDFADKVIRRTQPAFETKDLPSFFRGGEVEKMFTMFMNQRNQNFNFLAADIFGKAKAKQISKPEALRRLLWWAGQGIVLAAISRGRIPESEELARDLAAFPFSGVFMLGEIANSMIGGFDWNQPWSQPIREFVWAAHSKKPSTKIRHGIKGVGYIAGIPGTNAGFRFSEGMADLLNYRTDDLRRLMYSARALKKGK